MMKPIQEQAREAVDDCRKGFNSVKDPHYVVVKANNLLVDGRGLFLHLGFADSHDVNLPHIAVPA